MSLSQRFYPVAEPSIGAREEAFVLDAIRSGWVSSLGRYIGEFEQQFADYCGSAFGVSVCNGTAAMHLALATLDIGPGDEVIVPSLTFVATASAVAYTGAKVVFADVDPDTWCLDPVAVERALTARTRAIIPVHLYGHPADMDPLLQLAAPRGIHVLEDAAEAHGALYKGRRVGGIGKLGTFSFYGNKLITTGEGGMIVTDDSHIAERARFLRDHSMSTDKRYWHSELGFNYRLTNLQAALGCAQMLSIDTFLERKREIFAAYQRGLSERPEVQLNPELPWARSSYWCVSALLPNAAWRDGVMAVLHDEGVDTRPFFYPVHTLPHYRDVAPAVGRNGPGCPVTEQLASRGVNLPSAVNLTDDDVSYIARALKHALAAVPR